MIADLVVAAATGNASGALSTAPGNGRVAVGAVLLVALAAAALTASGVPLRRDVLTAALRAAGQLALVSAVIAAVLSAPPGAVALLTVMFSVSVATATRRIRLPRGLGAVAVASLAGLVPVLTIVFAVPVVPRSDRYLVALGGIVLGNTMTACTLTGRSFRRGLRDHREEVEGWLALGATPRTACRPVARLAIREALLPALDQTRTVGLVTLPGAFVGALAGGASAAGAARFQLIVLVGVMAAQACAGSVLAFLIGAPAQLPDAVESLPRDRAR